MDLARSSLQVCSGLAVLYFISGFVPSLMGWSANPIHRLRPAFHVPPVLLLLSPCPRGSSCSLT
eukprot:COSAG05_NODE_288_length_12074_cov_119.196827_4_plen_64_part_00